MRESGDGDGDGDGDGNGGRERGRRGGGYVVSVENYGGFRGMRGFENDL